MTRIRMIGLCLVAVFAMSAVVAASASAALPEYKACGKAAKNLAKKYTGVYTDKACSIAATPTEITEGKTNKYELVGTEKFKKLAFKGKGIVPAVNQIVNPITSKVEGATECTKEADTGTITGPKEQELTVNYQKCKALGKVCESPGAGAGKINTNVLVTTLVYLNAGHTEVGTLVKPKSGSIITEYNCEGQKVVATGAVIGQNSGNVNVINKEGTTTYTHGAGVLQQWQYVEGLGNEATAKGYYEWGYGFKKCVTKKMEEGKTQAEAEGACFGELGPFPGYPNKPIGIFSILSGAITAEAPSTQNSTNVQKGEKMEIQA